MSYGWVVVAALAVTETITWGIVYVLLVGAANGMLTLARATLISDIFGRGHYGSISGAMAMAGNGARALGPVGASLLCARSAATRRCSWSSPACWWWPAWPSSPPSPAWPAAARSARRRLAPAA